MSDLIVRLSETGEMASGSLIAQGTEDLDVSLVVDQDAEILQILIEKPSSTVLSIALDSDLQNLPTGASVLLVALTAEDEVTSALRSAGVLLQNYERGRLRVTTSGAVDGVKKVTVFLRRF